MNYKEVEGIDENGNPTTFKIEIPSAKQQLKQIENSYRELKGKVNNDPYIHLYEMLRFKAVEKELDEGEEAKEVLDIIIKKKIKIEVEEGYKGYNIVGYKRLTEIERKKIKKALRYLEN